MKKIIIGVWAVLFCCQIATSQHTVGLFLNDSMAENGYTLFTVGNTTKLINNCGYEINSWESLYKPGLAVYLLENGNLLRPCRILGDFNGGGIGGRIELFNWEGDLLWAYDYASPTFHQHHDVAPLPNGNFLLIAWEKISFASAVQAGRDPDLTPDQGVWPDKVVEIEMVDSNQINIVWEWHAWDHMIQDFDNTKDNFGVVADHPELLNANYEAHGSNGPINTGSDWLHCNAISYNAELDQIVLSSRHWSEIWVLDHSTTTAEAAGHSGGNSGMGGDIIYRYGNPEAYGRDGNAEKKFFRQHDVKWIPPGYPNEGKITVFNNGQGRPGDNYSSIDMIDPPVDASGNYILDAGEAYGPENLFWTYEADPPQSLYSANISGAQFLPNGNVLICDGNAARFFEIDLDGNLHWDYINPILSTGSPVAQGSTQQTADVFRVTRYSTDYPAFVGRDLTPGLPIELNPIPFNCQIFDGTTSTDNLLGARLNIFPNPASNQLNISWEGEELLIIIVYNLLGQTIDQISTNYGSTEVDISNWNNGTYFLKVEGLGVTKVVVAR